MPGFIADFCLTDVSEFLHFQGPQNALSFLYLLVM